MEIRTFTLEDANYALRDVIRVCEEAIEKMEETRWPWESLGFKKYDIIHQATAEQMVEMEWRQRIAEMGIMPKGWLIVDFQSPDPETVYCWQYGENEVSHEHKTWERFVHRRPIRPQRSREEGWRGEER